MGKLTGWSAGAGEQEQSWRARPGAARMWVGVLVLLAACGGNAPPTVASRHLVVLQGLPERLTLNAEDADGDALRFTVTRPPGHGLLSGTAPALTYSAASDYDGPDSFEVAVSDGKESASATIGFSVLPARGPQVPNGPQLDRLFLALARTLPSGGLSVAASKDGKLVFARGYGYAAAHVPMEASPRARIISVSYLLTMAAIMHLVEANALSLEDRLLTLVPALGPPADPRASAITVRNLLEHTSGLPVDFSGSSLFWTTSTLGGEVPCAEKVRQALAVPLDAAPGVTFQYSSMGFCALSTVIEHVTGKDYQRYVRDAVLAPMGVHGMRFAAAARADRPPDEVSYFDSAPCAETTRDQCRILSTTAGAAAWTGTTVDLTRVLEGLNRGYLRPETLARVMTPSALEPTCGLGMDLYDRGGRLWAGGSGSLDYGVVSLAYRRDDGWTWSLMANNAKLPADWAVLTPAWTPAIALLDAGVDLSASFPSTDLGPYDGR